MGCGLFGATFTAAGLSLCTYVWRNKLIHKQLMGTKGISEATGTITEKHTVSHQNTNANGHTTESTTYHVSYYFTAKINGEESQVYVDSATVADGHVWGSEALPKAAQVSKPAYVLAFASQLRYQA